MASGVGVDAQVEVVLIIGNPDDRVEVSAFEVAVEGELGVVLDGGVHAAEDAGVLALEISVELAEVGRHVLEVGVDGALVLEGVAPVELLVHLEAAGEPMAQVDHPLAVLAAEGGELLDDLVEQRCVEVERDRPEDLVLGSPASDDISVEGVLLVGDLHSRKVVYDCVKTVLHSLWLLSPS